MEKSKVHKDRAPASAKSSSAAAPPASVSGRVPPLFRAIDWLVLIICFGVVWGVYLFMLAPDLTLEDSGELCTASFYAGIPHPPGYPFWSIYSWLWTKLLPIGSVTWRVEVGESFAAAMACGLVGFMVSRGSSMLIEGIEELKSMDRKWESAICLVCGVTAGWLLGFDNFMWKEAVVINRIALFDVPWLMLVALCVMRWIYAPHQKRYLYTAMFFFGLCATIHQTMLCAAMGLEIAIAVTDLKLGRTFFLGNSIVFLGGVILMRSGSIPGLIGLSPVLLTIFFLVGVASIAAYVWAAIATRESFPEFCRDGAITGFFLFLSTVPIAGSGVVFLALLSLAAFVVLARNTWQQERGWLAVLICLLLWMLGVSFYFYEPIAGMTDPPMQWGYPRTVEGFFHAISRGQYEKANPTNIIADPMRFLMQLGLLINGLANSFNWVCLFLALVPFLFYFKMQKRERCWLISLTAIYFFVGILLVILMNTTPDRQTADENKVFFTASHAIVAVLIGYGLALLSAYMATHYGSFRRVALLMGLVTLLPALVMLYDGVGKTFYGGMGSLDYRQTLLLFLFMTAAFVLTALAAQWFLKTRAAGGEATGTVAGQNDPLLFWVFTATAFLCLAAAAGLAFFGKDQLSIRQVYEAVPRILAPGQYSLPVVAGLMVVAVVAAFIGGLLLYRQRAPMVISLGLFLVMPLSSAVSHWAKCEQRNHWFGYWFGHDMFTPPFVGPDGKLTYNSQLRAEMMRTNNLIYPEMARNAIIFGGTDPGRFCPTYMIFCESFVPPKDKPMDPDFDRRDCYLITQNALADGTYLDYLRAQYFRSAQQDPPFFREFIKYIAGLLHVQDNSLVRWSANLAYRLLDVPLTERGARIEARWRKEGVYPPKEIYIPSPEDSANCFQEYTEDVYRRQQEGRLLPGEDVQVDANGRVQVSGQVAVMMINGLLCRVIFDHNPSNEFYVEESFPLEWMYPYETPFGIIMQIHRHPIETLPELVFKRDHEFWTQYSRRLIGNWITYDTTVQQITNFVEKVYLRNDYSGFQGDRKFLRDDDAQKAFSKLRSSQAGMYAWRLRLLMPNGATDPQYLRYRPKTEAEIKQLYDEADFAFKQAFAFCPYSPEAVVRYVNFLIQFQRFDDALMVAQTCHQLDPYNSQISDLVHQIQEIQKQVAQQNAYNQQITARLKEMEDEARLHPTNYQNLILLGSACLQMQQTDRALGYFNQALTNPSIPYADAEQVVRFYTQIYSQPADLPKLESVIQRLVAIGPDVPEARYNLAAIQAMLGQSTEALDNLRIALELNAARLKTNPAANDLLGEARQDPHFNTLRQNPEFQKLVPP
ncbi:MAG TPA: DUF2723 domain-containing protein [Verrucomicrobiae bacterium]|nr:DUF2723 domain-containing protein [Verrucomicrobiae bacterium]